MNTKSKTLITILIPLLILGAIVAVYYLKQPGSVKNKKADYQLTSRTLNKEFMVNDSLAYAKYSKKVVELTGAVATIKNSEMHGIIVTLDDPMMGVKCVMDSTVKTLPTEVVEGSTVNIKGVCIGSDQLIGVMLNQCFITGTKAPAQNPSL